MRAGRRAPQAVARAGWLLLALAVAGAPAGCRGRRAPPPEVPVKGRVEHADGRPAEGLVLALHPRDESNKSAGLKVFPLEKGKGGRFEGRCPPGRYKVTGAPLPVTAGGAPLGSDSTSVGPGPPGKEATSLPARYRDAGSTPWEVTVPESGKDDIVLTLRP
jgi:hypothetical protein